MLRCTYLLPLLAGLALSSCYGPKEFTIKTTPPGATVSINGTPLDGTTPLVTRIEQSKDLGIVVRKPGYKTASETVRTQPSFWLGLLWTQNDPWARYIEEDEVTIPMQRIAEPEAYTPGVLPPYTGGGGVTHDIFAPRGSKGSRKGSDEAPPKLSPLPD